MNSAEPVSERLIFKKFTQREFTFVFENCSEDEIRKELGVLTDAAYIMEQEKYRSGAFSTPLIYFQLIDKSTSAIIGWCGFHHWFARHRRSEMGYYLLTDEVKRKGLMTEAIRPILNYGFHVMNLNRVEAFVGPDNVASLKLMQKYGFKQEGYLRQHYFDNNKLDDSLVFSLLREEYKM